MDMNPGDQVVGEQPMEGEANDRGDAERLVQALEARIDAQEELIGRLTQLLAASALNPPPRPRWWKFWR